ncbi:hypothetical protein B0H12DRAFT_1239999 [Mycena haematopus]|nr:hypothetical protein B0H12DRAFT_1239999 [Mycena haematopus]
MADGAVSVIDINTLVVDVGGSVGSITLELAKTFPHLRYVVQDLQKEISGGEKAASKESKIVLFDLVMPYACDARRAPCALPILPNLGVAGTGFITSLDIGVRIFETTD